MTGGIAKNSTFKWRGLVEALMGRRCFKEDAEKPA
jgi:hypothetical protein